MMCFGEAGGFYVTHNIQRKKDWAFIITGDARIMGLTYSVFEILGDAAKGDRIVSTTPEGRKQVTHKRNPVITGIVVAAAAGILIVYLDGGNGLISTSLGRVCVRCRGKY